MFWKLLRQRGVDLGGCPPWSPPLGRSAEEPPPWHGSSCQACWLSVEGFSGHHQAAPWVSFPWASFLAMVAGAARSLGQSRGLSSSLPGCLALFSTTQGRTEGAGQRTGAVGVSMEEACRDLSQRAGLAVPSAASELVGPEVGS